MASAVSASRACHTRTLEAMRLDTARTAWTEVGAYDETSMARIAPFEGVELEVGRLFPPART